jgi:hypothetical protein
MRGMENREHLEKIFASYGFNPDMPGVSRLADAIEAWADERVFKAEQWHIAARRSRSWKR